MTTTSAPLATRARMTDAQLAVLAVTASVVTWGFGTVLVKLTSLDGVAFSVYRIWLGLAALLAMHAVTRRPITMASLRVAAPAGAILGANMLLAFSSIKLTSVANATLIGALQPALVLLVAGPLFAERVGRREAGWAALSILGVAIVIVGSAGAPSWSPTGDLLAAGGLVLFTTYFLISKRARGTLDTLDYVTGIHLGAALVVTPVALVARPDLGTTPGDWAALSFIVLISGVGGHLLMNWAHPYIDVSVSSQIMVAAPVVAAASAWMILGEPLRPLQFAGGALALAAIIAIVRRQPSVEAMPAA